MCAPVAKQSHRDANLKAEEGNKQRVLFIRVPPNLAEKIDAVIARYREQRPGFALSQSDVLRDLLYKAVASEEVEIRE